MVVHKGSQAVKWDRPPHPALNETALYTYLAAIIMSCFWSPHSILSTRDLRVLMYHRISSSPTSIRRGKEVSEAINILVFNSFCQFRSRNAKGLNSYEVRFEHMYIGTKSEKNGPKHCKSDFRGNHDQI